MTRQTDNRQHQIAQALAFLSQYRKLRGGLCQETEYNFARAFHHLGEPFSHLFFFSSYGLLGVDLRTIWV